jgi:hypothetical protein
MSTPAWKKAQRQAEHVKQKEERALAKLFVPIKKTRKTFEEYKPSKPTHRSTPRVPSLMSNGGNCNKRETKVYSGDYMIGIATMHKSNLVPVGREDNPINYSTMRRN